MVQNIGIKRKITSRMDGSREMNDESRRMHKESVEDCDFPGRDDSHIAPEERTESILHQMSLEEKIRFIGGYKELGIHPLPRYGLPSIWCSDATAGLRCFKGGTAFPAPLSMAATWNQDLIEKAGAAIGEEFRHTGVSILLGPGINIYRVPTCGRNFEYMGEDPFLAGKMASAYIRGAQASGVITTVKHFACNNSEYDRHKTDSTVSERTLREIYLPAFEMAVKEGGTRGVMSAYNPVNGSYSSENHHLLTEILRKEWEFDGLVMSDWNSLYSTSGPVRNGLDIEMPHARWLTEKKIQKELAKGRIRIEDIDRMVRNLMGTLFKCGIYDRPQKDPESSFYCKEHVDLAGEVASEGIVLLKNKENILPFTPGEPGVIVVMGRMAERTETGGGGSSYVQTENATDFLTGLRNACGEKTIDHIPWSPEKLSSNEMERIRSADAVLYCAGYSHLEESECWDRSWDLPYGQSDSILETTELNPNTLVVLTAGGGVNTTGWIDKVKGFIHSFYLGETAGNALADILFGTRNPSGKLPFTMSEHWEDFGSTAHYVSDPGKTNAGRIYLGQGNPLIRRVHPMDYQEGIFIGYRHFDRENITPLFPFGFGLSYTNFSFTGLKTEILNEEETMVRGSLSVENTGNTAGAETVQIYVGDDDSTLIRPPKELKGFSKIFLEPGESKTVRFSLNKRAFQYYDPYRGDWRLEPGDFYILVGNSSQNILLTDKITLL